MHLQNTDHLIELIFAVVLGERRQNVSLESQPTKVKRSAVTSELVFFVKGKPLFEFSIDNAIIFKTGWWPKIYEEFKTRDRAWPEYSIMNELLNSCNIISKPSDKEVGDEETLEFRYSFAHLERTLVMLRTQQQNHIYLVFKVLFTKYVKPLSMSGELGWALFDSVFAALNVACSDNGDEEGYFNAAYDPAQLNSGESNGNPNKVFIPTKAGSGNNIDFDKSISGDCIEGATGGDEDDQSHQKLTSFLCKNTMLWFCERIPPDHGMWTGTESFDGLVKVLEHLFGELLTCFRENNMQYYFDPQVNLIACISENVRLKTVDRIGKVLGTVKQLLYFDMEREFTVCRQLTGYVSSVLKILPYLREKDVAAIIAKYPKSLPDIVQYLLEQREIEEKLKTELDRALKRVDKEVKRSGDKVVKEVERTSKRVEKEVKRSGDKMVNEVERTSKRVEEEVQRSGVKVEKEVERTSKRVETEVKRSGDKVKAEAKRFLNRFR